MITNAQSHRICYAAEYDGVFYGVAGWSNPVARLLPQQMWLELRRMALADDAPKNTASRFLGWMKRDIAVRLPNVERLISYQDTSVHAGTIYRAAGWNPTLPNDVRSGGRHWDYGVRGQSRNEKQSAAPKILWVKDVDSLGASPRGRGRRKDGMYEVVPGEIEGETP